MKGALRKMNKIIYLDIDGVLNSDDFAKFCLEEEGYNPFIEDELDPRAIKNLKYIIDETGAKIILSSSWRWESDARDAVHKQLKMFNLDFIDTTTMEIGRCKSRTMEIEAHLQDHPEIKNYVILDDDEIESPLNERHVKTTFKFGLTREKAEQAINILNGVNNG
jgi:hypothetical protein